MGCKRWVGHGTGGWERWEEPGILGSKQQSEETQDMDPMFWGKLNYIKSKGRYNWVARPSVIFLFTILSLKFGFALGTWVTLWLFQAVFVFYPAQHRAWKKDRCPPSSLWPKPFPLLLKIINSKCQATKLYYLLSLLVAFANLWVIAPGSLSFSPTSWLSKFLVI